MKIYLRILAFFYFTGGILHTIDLLGLRLKFGSMSLLWQSWIIYLLIFDLLATAGLWYQKKWGVSLFFLISFSQLIAYIGFTDYFGSQLDLVIFHIITLTIYFFVRSKSKKSVHLLSRS